MQLRSACLHRLQNGACVCLCVFEIHIQTYKHIHAYNFQARAFIKWRVCVSVCVCETHINISTYVRIQLPNARLHRFQNPQPPAHREQALHIADINKVHHDCQHHANHLYTYGCIHTHTHTYTYIHTHTHTHTHTRTHKRMHTHTHTCTNIQTDR